MSAIAHATLAAPGFDAEKRAMATTAQHEIAQAKHIQQQTGCAWTEALRIAYSDDSITAYYRDRNRGGWASTRNQS